MEVVLRRYKKAAGEKEAASRPIIIDGGGWAAQPAGESVRALNLPATTAIIGLAKNEEEVFSRRQSVD